MLVTLLSSHEKAEMGMWLWWSEGDLKFRFVSAWAAEAMPALPLPLMPSSLLFAGEVVETGCSGIDGVAGDDLDLSESC